MGVATLVSWGPAVGEEYGRRCSRGESPLLSGLSGRELAVWQRSACPVKAQAAQKTRRSPLTLAAAPDPARRSSPHGP